MRLHTEKHGPITTRASHCDFLVRWPWPRAVPAQRCDRGTDTDRSDNIALAAGFSRNLRWASSPIKHFRSSTLFSPISGHTRAFWTEIVDRSMRTLHSPGHDFGESFVISVPVGSVPERPLGCRALLGLLRPRRQLTVNGRASYRSTLSRAAWRPHEQHSGLGLIRDLAAPARCSETGLQHQAARADLDLLHLAPPGRPHPLHKSEHRGQ